MDTLIIRIHAMRAKNGVHLAMWRIRGCSIPEDPAHQEMVVKPA
jgi:hypothetical protein